MFSETAALAATLNSLGVVNEFILAPSTHNFVSRSLLQTEDEEDDGLSEERLYNDAMRALKFVTIFTLFSLGFCSLSFYVYNHPYDTPNGTSFVSKLRRIPGIGWFFRQPQYAVQRSQSQSQHEEDVSLINDTDNNNNENDVELGDTDSSKTPSGAQDNENNKSRAVSPPASTKTYLFNSPNITLLLCAIGLLVAYLTWGFMQERIMAHPYGDPSDESNWFKSSEFCVLLNRLFGVVVSSVALRFSGRSGRYAPAYQISLCALSNMSSSWFQYESLHFVTFPVQTIFKSSKILITMFVGKFVQNKTFPLRKYLTALTIAIGVYIFLDGQKSASKRDTSQDLGYYFYLGLLMISAYACLDAFTSNWQSKVFEQTKIGSLEMMQTINIITFTVSFMFCVTDLMNIFQFYVDHPAIIGHSLIMGCCSGFGQVLIFYTIQTFGAVTFATVMTTRMVISVLLSIFYYGHPLSTQGIFGMVITFLALFYQVYDKSQGKKSSGTKDGKK